MGFGARRERELCDGFDVLVVHETPEEEDGEDHDEEREVVALSVLHPEGFRGEQGGFPAKWLHERGGRERERWKCRVWR